jgi:hypothetical protein
MSPQDEDDVQSEDPEAAPGRVSRSAWKAVWTKNKGMFLILISEIAGSSMDAIVRFLQQGGHGMHPLQVCSADERLLYLEGADFG